jgi:hypothetical protein
VSDPRQAKDDAVREALRLFRYRWPRKFSLENEPMDLKFFGSAVGHVTIDCVVPAAEQILRDGKYPPTPPEFRAIAEQVQAYLHPALPQSDRGSVRDPDLQASLDVLAAQRHRQQQRAVWILRHVGSRAGLEAVYGILWQRAQTDEDRARLRRGEETKAEVLLAITEYERRVEREGMQLDSSAVG